MNNQVVSRAAWLEARRELLTKEKAHTQASERLAKLRRQLPWVKLEKDYVLQGTDGNVSLLELFADCSQLVVYHLMFGPEWETPCIGCTSWANAFNGTTDLFQRADARLIAVSRAPVEKLVVERETKGWSFVWVSSIDSDFNVDFYASSEDLSKTSTKVIGGDDGELVEFDRGENHGVSVFAKNEEEVIFHTYSTYNRGIEAMNGAFGYFDLLPKGRAW